MSLRRLFFLGIAIALLAAPCVGQSSGSEGEVRRGADAYKNGRYDEAIQHLEHAVVLDPENTEARMYLATAYAQEYIPGVDKPANHDLAEHAITQYDEILRIDSTNKNAVTGKANLLLQMKEFDKAKEAFRQAIRLDSDNPEPYYSIAVIDWTESYQPRMDLRHKLGLKPEQSLIHRAECWDLRNANRDRVQDGIEMLTEALARRKDYDDAMAYMNLMYRERADMDCDDPVAHARDLKTADKWVDLTLSVKKAKAERQPGARPIECPPDVPANCGGGASSSPSPQ